MMTTTSHQQGFTLLEVMIALVIFSIGLLGLAGLQGISVNNNQVAFSRTVASQLAYDIADRIRNNKTADYKIDTDNITGTPASCVTSSKDCNPSALAAYDLWEWKQTLTNSNNNLSAAEGFITSATSGYTITIAWDEKNVGGLSRPLDCTNTNVECISLTVQP